MPIRPKVEKRMKKCYTIFTSLQGKITAIFTSGGIQSITAHARFALVDNRHIRACIARKECQHFNFHCLANALKVFANFD